LPNVILLLLLLLLCVLVLLIRINKICHHDLLCTVVMCYGFNMSYMSMTFLKELKNVIKFYTRRSEIEKYNVVENLHDLVMNETYKIVCYYEIVVQGIFIERIRQQSNIEECYRMLDVKCLKSDL